jgi:hypothetical protein
MWTAFDYMYRDAGNFKAFGTVILEGQLCAADQAIIRSSLSSGEFFIAEEVGVPALYHELYRWSGGPTDADHCWHEFVEFREIADPADGRPARTVADFLRCFAAVNEWNEALSPHFALDAA